MKKQVWIVGAIILSLPFYSSCADRRQDEFERANARLMMSYRSTNVLAAEAALLAYRQEVIGSKGFAGRVDTNSELKLVDARLFSVNLHLGRESNAHFWFNSSVSNLNAYRREKGLSLMPTTTTNALEESIRKLDSNINVAWRTNFIRR